MAFTKKKLNNDELAIIIETKNNEVSGINVTVPFKKLFRF